jgi:hypothetical protein
MTAPHAERRPALWRSLSGPVLIWHVYESCAFALLALPVLDATLASGIAHFPEPARRLFSAGGLWLLELLEQQKSSLLASLGPMLWLLAAACCLGLVPEWWLLRALVRQRSGALAPAAPVLVRFSLLALGFWLLRAPTWLFLSALTSPPSALASPPDERVRDLLLLAGLAVWLILQLGLSLLRDLVALFIVSGSRSPQAALRHAREQLLPQALGLMVRYGAFRALGFGTWLGAEVVLLALPGAGTAHAGVSFAVHQLALLARIALHATWLSSLQASLGAARDDAALGVSAALTPPV